MNLKINNSLEVICDARDTNQGFAHVAKLYQDDQLITKTSCQYINRTWECYRFSSVLHKLLGKSKRYLTLEEYKLFEAKI